MSIRAWLPSELSCLLPAPPHSREEEGMVRKSSALGMRHRGGMWTNGLREVAVS